MATTIVTGYFDLSRFSGPIRKLKFWYISDASNFTLKLPLPMIIFVEESDADTILNIRKEYQDITRVITISLTDLALWDTFPTLQQLYDNKVIDPNVKGYSPAYVVTVNSKMQFMNSAMDLNPFSTSYFMWVDFGIKARGYTMDIDFPKIIDIAKDPQTKPSFAIISPTWNSTGYDGFRWIAAGGLMTFPNGCQQFFKDCQKLFRELVSQGHYALEETVMFLLWKQNPDHFNVFYANYDTLALKYHGNCPASQAKQSRPDCLNELTKIIN